MQDRGDCILAFFGCFSPPTNGHLGIAAMAFDHLKSLGFNMLKAIMIPAHGGYGKPGLVPAEYRVEMCRLMARTTDFLEVEDVEAKKTEWSRTIDTLQYLQDKYPGVRIMLLFGIDVIKGFEKHWREPDVIRILEEFGIVVTTRGDVEIDDVSQFCPWLVGRTQNVVIIRTNPVADLSSSLVRQALKDGRHTSGWMAPDVEKYIAERNMYK